MLLTVIMALGDIMEILSISKKNPHTYGYPTYCIEYKAESVHIKFSCRVDTPPTIVDPLLSGNSPDWFVVEGTH